MKFLNSIAAAAALAAVIASCANAEVKAGETLYGTAKHKEAGLGHLTAKHTKILVLKKYTY